MAHPSVEWLTPLGSFRPPAPTPPASNNRSGYGYVPRDAQQAELGAPRTPTSSRPDARPENTRPNARPENTRPNARPENTRPNARPVSAKPDARPVPAKPDARPEARPDPAKPAGGVYQPPRRAVDSGAPPPAENADWERHGGARGQDRGSEAVAASSNRGRAQGSRGPPVDRVDTWGRGDDTWGRGDGGGGGGGPVHQDYPLNAYGGPSGDRRPVRGAYEDGYSGGANSDVNGRSARQAPLGRALSAGARQDPRVPPPPTAPAPQPYDDGRRGRDRGPGGRSPRPPHAGSSTFGQPRPRSSSRDATSSWRAAAPPSVPADADNATASDAVPAPAAVELARAPPAALEQTRPPPLADVPTRTVASDAPAPPGRSEAPVRGPPPGLSARPPPPALGGGTAAVRPPTSLDGGAPVRLLDEVPRVGTPWSEDAVASASIPVSLPVAVPAPAVSAEGARTVRTAPIAISGVPAASRLGMWKGEVGAGWRKPTDTDVLSSSVEREEVWMGAGWGGGRGGVRVGQGHGLGRVVLGQGLVGGVAPGSCVFGPSSLVGWRARVRVPSLTTGPRCLHPVPPQQFLRQLGWEDDEADEDADNSFTITPEEMAAFQRTAPTQGAGPERGRLQ